MAAPSTMSNPQPCPGRRHCDAEPYVEIAWSDGSSSAGHPTAIRDGRHQLGEGWAHTDPTTCPHGGEMFGIILPDGSVVCRGCGMDFT
jgi:hypothetical protein